jgi:hypothetical protein
VYLPELWGYLPEIPSGHETVDVDGRPGDSKALIELGPQPPVGTGDLQNGNVTLPSFGGHIRLERLGFALQYRGPTYQSGLSLLAYSTTPLH